MNPKKLSNTLLIALSVVTTFIISCANHGKKITIAGTKGEVYYKGDGVTEADAQKLGDFLKENSYFDEKEKTVQLKKNGKDYEVRMVVDMDVVNKTAGIDDAYSIYGASIAKSVFDGTPTVIILCDKEMNDKKTYPYKPEVLKTAEVKENTEGNNSGDENAEPDTKGMKEKSFANNSLYYDRSVSEDEAGTVFDYLKKNEFFIDGGNNDVIVKKGDNDEAIFQFPVKREYANEEGLAKVEEFVTRMKADLFTRVKLSFQVMDEKYAIIKTFNL